MTHGKRFLFLVLLFAVCIIAAARRTEGFMQGLSWNVQWSKNKFRLYHNGYKNADISALIERDPLLLEEAKDAAGAHAIVEDAWLAWRAGGHVVSAALPGGGAGAFRILVFLQWGKENKGTDTVGYLPTQPGVLSLLQQVMVASPTLQKARAVPVPVSKNALLAWWGTLDELKALAAKDATLGIWSLEDADIHVLKLGIPFAQLVDIDFSVYMRSLDKFPVKRCVRTDLLLVADRKSNVTLDVAGALLNPSRLEVENYYTQYFSFAPASLRLLRAHNDHTQMRLTRELPILEQFAGPAPALKITHPVEGFLDARRGVFYVHVEARNEIETGMQVELTGQEREEENGVYKVIAPGTLQRISLPEQKKEDPYKDARYKCVNQPRITLKAQCDKEGHVWDRPCETNAECPYYQANTIYRNYRGGCNDGYCEFPIGVKRKSWRIPDASTGPMCHGTGHCPKEGGDIAFENDEADRRVREPFVPEEAIVPASFYEALAQEKNRFFAEEGEAFFIDKLSRAPDMAVNGSLDDWVRGVFGPEYRLVDREGAHVVIHRPGRAYGIAVDVTRKGLKGFVFEDKLELKDIQAVGAVPPTEPAPVAV